MEAPEYFHGAGATPEKKAGGGCGENFAVEDLLDFSNEEEDEEESGAVLAAGDDGWAFAGGTMTVTAFDSCSNSFSGGDLIRRSFPDANLSADICEPYGELAELEWLSNFVDDSSFPSEDLPMLHLISGISSTATSSSSSCASPIGPPADRAPQPPIFRPEGPVPGKARSKRSRTAPCNWSSRLLMLSPSRNSAASPESELIVQPSSVVPNKKPAKPAKKKELSAAGPGVALAASAAGEGRTCLHCQTDKTPQWRTGPMGPKTLCNACGVRYKSGRLVPEYRPAASPTFVLSKHSNSHRKVLELRRQKEQQQHLLSPGGGNGGALFDGMSPMAVAGDNFLIHHRLGAADFGQLI